MKRHIFWISLVLSLTFFVGNGFSGPREIFEGPPSEEQRAKIRERVETLKMWKLTKILDLDEEGATRLFPLLNRYDKKRATVAKNMQKDMMELREIVDTASEKELKATIRRLKDNHRRLQKIDQEEIEKLNEILTVREMAKLIIFKHDFDREMKKVIADVRKRHRAKMKREIPRPPED